MTKDFEAQARENADAYVSARSAMIVATDWSDTRKVGDALYFASLDGARFGRETLQVQLKRAVLIDADWRHHTECETPQLAHEKMNSDENRILELQAQLKLAIDALGNSCKCEWGSKSVGDWKVQMCVTHTCTACETLVKLKETK